MDGYDLAKRRRAETLRNKKKVVKDNDALHLASLATASLAVFLTKILGYNPLGSTHSEDRGQLSRRKALTNDNVLKLCERLPAELYGPCTAVGKLKQCAEKQVFRPIYMHETSSLRC